MFKGRNQMRAKLVRMFLAVSLLTMGLLVVTPTPAFACHIEVGGDADCDGFSGWARNYMGQTVIFKWKVELYQGGVRVDLKEGQSGQIPHGGTYSFSETWTHAPMCGDFHVKAWAGAYEPDDDDDPIAEKSVEGDLHCDCDYGSITIVKETDPDGGTGFNFSGDLGCFTLNDDGSKSFDDLAAGDYDVTESVPADWELDSVECTGGDSTAITNGVTIYLDAGEHVTCTFNNIEQGGPQAERRIKARKFNDENGDGDKDCGEDWLNGWQFTLYRKENDAWVEEATTTTTGSGSSKGTADFGEWPIGDEYKIEETRQDGWTCTNCDTAEEPFTLQSGCCPKKVQFGNRQSPIHTCCEGATSITFKNVSSGNVDLWFYEGTQANHDQNPFATFDDVAPGSEVTLNASDYFASGYFPEYIYNYGTGCHWHWDIQLICDDPASLAVGDRSPGWGEKLEVVGVVWEGECDIGDRVWHDESGNGDQNANFGVDEPGFNDVDVYLYDYQPTTCGEAGYLAMTTTISGTSQTPDGWPDGIYGFNMDSLGLGTGTYWVCVDEGTLPYQQYGWDLTPGSSNPRMVSYTTGTDDFSIDFGYEPSGPPTAVTLSSFTAKPSAGGPVSRLWPGLVGLTALAASSLFWTKRRAG